MTFSLPGLAGKVVVVTGAARGQGLALAELLATQGAHVIATDVVERGSPPKTGTGATEFRQLDVASESEWNELATDLRERGVTVHGLVNNAGVPWRARLGEVLIEDWNRVIAINLTGPMLGMQALAPLMTEGSSIVNIGSAAAVTAHHTAAYTASKWGLRGLSRVASTEFGARGIRVNLVNPGYIETPMMAAAPAVMTAAQLALTPLGRTGHADEVASVVAFLLSDAGAYISGAEISVDGGFVAAGGVKYMSDTIRAATST